MAKYCALTVAVRQALRETLSSRARLRLVMRVNEILGADSVPGIDAVALQAAREKWAADLPELLRG